MIEERKWNVEENRGNCMKRIDEKSKSTCKVIIRAQPQTALLDLPLLKFILLIN